MGAKAVRVTDGSDSARLLYDRIWDFLWNQRLAPTPTNYSLAHHILTEPDGALAKAVRALTEGGIRLTYRDIQELVGDPRAAATRPAANQQQAEGLVARTQMQVEGFQDMVTAMRAETEGFGRDLAASAEAISRSADAIGEGDGAVMVGEVARITGAMLRRVRSAEARLETATREASDLRKKLEEARDNARRDPLTQLPNRRAFEEAYAAQAAAGTEVNVAICDVDHFKSVNDRFGHAVGDRVLKAIAEALSQACLGHLVARYGGEEFAVLFTGVDLDKARATLDAARELVASKRYRLRESDAPLGAITFSAGLTKVRQSDNYHAAYQRADELLYAAKTAGRNCVCAE